MQLTTALTPSWCRWDTTNPPRFTIWHNLLYATVGGVFSANLYYSHPILEVMARDFNTTQSGVANIPTLAQAGDAMGLLFILPLADFFPRRGFTLGMLTCTVVFWLGLCITRNVAVFQALTFLSAVTTGIIQILLVLVAEVSTPETRAFNISIVATGPTFAILLARILSGIVANYTSWRNVYWLSLGLQVVVLALMACFMPDYPVSAVNSGKPKREVAKGYPKLLLSILALFPKHSILVQVSLLSFLTFFCVSSFWTTLTFLLSEPQYAYSTLAIGLFGLIGACTMVLGPLFARYIIQPLRAPLLGNIVGTTTSLVGVVLGTALGRTNVAGPVLQALLLDAGLMIGQVSSRTAIHGIEPGKENRVNTAFTTCLYLGMLTGTKAGNDVYEMYGGWLAAGGLSVGIISLSYIVIVVKGPHEKGWVGWSGGWGRYSKNSSKQDEENVPETKKDVAESADTNEKQSFDREPEERVDGKLAEPQKGET